MFQVGRTRTWSDRVPVPGRTAEPIYRQQRVVKGILDRYAPVVARLGQCLTVPADPSTTPRQAGLTAATNSNRRRWILAARRAARRCFVRRIDISQCVRVGGLCITATATPAAAAAQ